MGDPHEQPEQPAKKPSIDATSRRQYLKSGLLLVVSAVSLYLLLPSLLSVFSSWRSLLRVDWRFGVLVLLFEVASSVCLWEVNRIALGSKGWFPVACSQLAGNAVGRIVPGTATPFTVVMLEKTGLGGGEAAAALTASTGLQISTALALPVLAIPAIMGGAPVNHGLATAAYLGAGVFVLLIGAGAVLFNTDAPLEWLGRTIQRALNATVRRRQPVTGLSRRLLSDRDFIRSTLDRGWRSALVAAVGNTGFDYLLRSGA
jgi:hypothetical protein